MSFTQGVFAKHAQQILAEEAEYGVANTALAYGTKKKEFIGYCNHQFPQQADFCEFYHERSVYLP